MAGVTKDCKKYYKTVDGDICFDIGKKHGISLDDFLAWNPQVTPDCKNLWVGYYVCVGI
jgi:hypothetical protein